MRFPVPGPGVLFVGYRCNALAPGWVDTPINYAHAEMLGGLSEVYATIDSFRTSWSELEP